MKKFLLVILFLSLASLACLGEGVVQVITPMQNLTIEEKFGTGNDKDGFIYNATGDALCSALNLNEWSIFPEKNQVTVENVTIKITPSTRAIQYVNAFSNNGWPLIQVKTSIKFSEYYFQAGEVMIVDSAGNIAARSALRGIEGLPEPLLYLVSCGNLFYARNQLLE